MLADVPVQRGGGYRSVGRDNSPVSTFCDPVASPSVTGSRIPVHCFTEAAPVATRKSCQGLLF